jgi:methylenetetrahydrofolate reductase (NADPH)
MRMNFPVPSSQRPTLSFEFFPPKTEDGWATLRETLADTRRHHLDFVSVTYGAGGSTRAKTIEVCSEILRHHGIPPMAHLTCVGHSVKEIDAVLDQLQDAGVSTILALRGDPPKGEANFVPHPEGFAYASDLIAHIAKRRSFRIACAYYPEVHPQAVTAQRDMDALLLKQASGASLGFSQMFFEADAWLRFRDAARAAGVTIPLLAGIMPISNLQSILRFAQGCGAAVPQSVVDRLSPLEHDPEAMVQAGIELAADLSERLVREGCEGIHLYTLNKTTSSPRVVELLRERGLFRI